MFGEERACVIEKGNAILALPREVAVVSEHFIYTDNLVFDELVERAEFCGSKECQPLREGSEGEIKKLAALPSSMSLSSNRSFKSSLL